MGAYSTDDSKALPRAGEAERGKEWFAITPNAVEDAKALADGQNDGDAKVVLLTKVAAV
jgi:hypothetical protein